MNTWTLQALSDLRDTAAHTPGYLLLVMLVFIALLHGLDRLCTHLAPRGPRWAYWTRWVRIYARVSVLLICAVLLYWRAEALLA